MGKNHNATNLFLTPFPTFPNADPISISPFRDLRCVMRAGWCRGYSMNKVSSLLCVFVLLLVGCGKPDGMETGWYESGQKSSETNYKDGKLHGLITWWYENGQKKLEANFKDGKLHGLHTTWHENGQKQSELNYYKDGEKHGLWTWWDKDGNITWQSKWENGTQILK